MRITHLIVVVAALAASTAHATCGPVTAVAAGNSHVVLLRDDGTAWTVGPLEERGVLVNIPTPVRQVAAAEYSAALATDGSVWTWFGSQMPARATGMPSIDLIAATDGSVFAVDGGGAAYDVTRGSVNAGSFSAATLPLVALSAQRRELVALDSAGIAWRIEQRPSCGFLGQPMAPGPAIAVAGLPPLISIAARDEATLALAADGRTWIWGCFEAGLALDPAATASDVPLPSAVVPGARSVALTGGTAFAVDPVAGVARSWGRGWFIGDGTGFSKPATAPGTVNLAGVQSISGGMPIIAALDATGQAWIWGEPFAPRTPTIHRVPTEIPGLSSMVDVSVGWDHAIAVGADGRAWAWGYGFDGKLGVGPGSTFVMTPLEMVETGFVQAEAGLSVTVLRKADGTAWSCGWGIGGVEGVAAATPMQAPGLAAVIDVAAGESHALALLADGSVWGWGTNRSGELGLGAITYQGAPAQVPGLSGVVDVSASERSSFALKSDGSLWAWGFNDGCRFADCDISRLSAPTMVLPGPYSAHSQGGFHSLALTSGVIASWGWAAEGALGCGDNGDCAATMPVQLPAPLAPDRIDAGFNASYAIFADGSAWAWGWNEYGFVAPELPDDRIFAPRLMTTLPPVAEISSGASVTVARLQDGRVLSWGDAAGGALGRDVGAFLFAPRALDLGDALAGLGDTLRLRRDASGTVLTWGTPWGASVYRVYRSTRPDRSDESLVAEVPLTTWTDTTPAAPLLCYRVSGVNCAGVEGP